jgi:hypothetical protein
MTKKNILLLSFVGASVYGILFLYSDSLYDYCFAGGRCLEFWNSLKIIGPIIFPFPAVFLFSLITYFMREETFRSWLHFVYWWVPLSIFLTLITTESGGGGFGPQMSWGKEDTAFVFSALFAVISLILIIVKSWKLKGK